MMKLYRYLYYRLYSWNLKTWGEKDLPQWNALFGVSFMMGLNLGIIAGLIDMIGVVNIFVENTPKKGIIIFAFVILVANYFWLVHNGKYRQIAKEYKNEPKNKKLRSTLFLWLYVVISFVIISFIAILSGKLKGLQ
ncbi:MAG: hypothetical protein PHS59_09290 [Paludibacter sp.]|nr:hypothetical protein [Paludibacter sp.]